MVSRTFFLALNGYREAVRARVLHGLLGLALATTGYALVVGTLSLRNDQRVVADLGAASLSLYAVLVAIVLGATSLHRELEMKTIFPILTRRLRRHEFVLGKYAGMVLTLAVFVALDAAAVLGILAVQAGQPPVRVAEVALALLAVLAVLLVRLRESRVFVAIPWAAALLVAMALLGAPAGAERRLVLASATLTMAEVAIIAAVAVLFASFSTPFLSAIFTLGVFLVGRSADLLANLPPRVFGQAVHDLGHALSRIFPNLHVYSPARPLLLGEVDGIPLWPFVARAWLQAGLYATVLLVLASLVFRKRDFT